MPTPTNVTGELLTEAYALIAELPEKVARGDSSWVRDRTDWFRKYQAMVTAMNEASLEAELALIDETRGHAADEHHERYGS